MNKDIHNTGLVFAVLLGGFHAFWSLLVLLGWAQRIVDFILWAHMIHVPYVVGPFELSAAFTLVLMTAAIGYLVGITSRLVWMKIHPVI